MRLILHIVGKDFARLRGRLAVWFAVMAAKISLGFFLVLGAPVDGDAFLQLQLGVVGIIVVEAALTMLLGAMMVQEDGVAGTPAFWRTRPIARGRLLAAKLLGAFLLLVLPAVLVALPWWWICGLEAGQMAVAAGEVAGFQTILLVVAFAAATVTPTLGRCLVWGIVTVLGVNVLLGSSSYWLPGFFNSQGAEHGIVLLCLAATLVAVVLVQYVLPRRHLGLTVLGGGLLFAIFGTQVLVRSFSTEAKPQEDWQDQRPALAQAVGISFVSATLDRSENSRRRLDYLDLRYEATNLPSGHTVGYGRVIYRWKGANGKDQVVDSWVSGSSIWHAAVRLTNPENKTPAGRPAKAELHSGLNFPRDEMAHFRAQPVSMHATLHLTLWRPERLFASAIGNNHWQRASGFGARVVRTKIVETGVKADVIEAEPFGLLDEMRRSSVRPWQKEMETLYAVSDPERTLYDTQRGFAQVSVYLGGVRVRSRTVNFWVSEQKRAVLTEAAAADWLKILPLTVVRVSTVSAFTRELEMPGVEAK